LDTIYFSKQLSCTSHFSDKDHARPITKKEDKKRPTKRTKHKEKGRRPQKAHVVHGKQRPTQQPTGTPEENEFATPSDTAT
jgi:hypothetical protein